MGGACTSICQFVAETHSAHSVEKCLYPPPRVLLYGEVCISGPLLDNTSIDDTHSSCQYAFEQREKGRMMHARTLYIVGRIGAYSAHREVTRLE